LKIAKNTVFEISGIYPKSWGFWGPKKKVAGAWGWLFSNQKLEETVDKTRYSGGF